MPNKAHRAASRQAQLKRRRRRGKTRTQEFDPGPTESRAVTAVEESAIETEVEAVPTVEPVAPPMPSAARRPRQRTSAPEPLAATRFLAGELRRIGAISALIVAILAVLTVFLRS